MDLQVRHRAEVAEQRVERERFAETEKITEKQIKIKVMLMFFLDCRGIMRHEIAPEGQTVNAAFYVKVMKRLIDCVRRV